MKADRVRSLLACKDGMPLFVMLCPERSQVEHAGPQIMRPWRSRICHRSLLHSLGCRSPDHDRLWKLPKLKERKRVQPIYTVDDARMVMPQLGVP